MTRRHKIAAVFGTRPEVIKLFPVIRRLEALPVCEALVLATGQQRDLQTQVVAALGLRVDEDLDVMEEDQSLSSLTARLVRSLTPALERRKPDLVLVQGDTTTALAGALSALYAKIPVGHVEAGLRTGCKYAPFPEEMNRKLIGSLADLHFVPTPRARDNLLAEGVAPGAIFFTGNTVVDALHLILEDLEGGRREASRELAVIREKGRGRKIVLVTGHRRENFGEGMRRICDAIRAASENFAGALFVYPVHPNPNVFAPVHRLLGSLPNVLLVRPLDYVSFVGLLNESHLVLTDSGGVQEEAATLGKPTLVLREATERAEAVECGVARLVGTCTDAIVGHVLSFLNAGDAQAAAARPTSVFGDGHAAELIVEHCLAYLTKRPQGVPPPK